MTALALVLSYDGSGFLGSQRQAKGRTVQGVLADTLARIFGKPVATVFAGRTDRGVHASGQVVSFRLPVATMGLNQLRAALNDGLPDDVAVRSIRPVGDAFDARLGARWREYRYRIWTGSREPLTHRWVWRRSAEIDRERMARAAAIVLGRHDFASFTGGGEGVPWSERQQRPLRTVRTVLRSEVSELEPWWCPVGSGEGRLMEYRVAADGFLPRLVRSLVSALVEVGQGRRDPEWVAELLAAHDRRCGGGTAPPHGLTLWRVGYAAFPGTGCPD